MCVFLPALTHQKVFVQSKLLLSVLLMCCPLRPQGWQRRHGKSFCHAASSRDSWTMLSKFPHWETSHHRVHKLPQIHLHKHKWIHAQRHFSRFHFSEVRRRTQWAQIEKVSTSERGWNGCDEGGWNYWDAVSFVIRQSEATLGLGCTRHEEQWSVLNTAGKLMANSKQAARGEFLSWSLKSLQIRSAVSHTVIVTCFQHAGEVCWL